VTVIELGDLTAGDDRPATGTPRRRLDRRLFRRVAIALLGLLCLTSLTASAVPVARGLRSLWRVPFSAGDAFQLTGDGLYVLRNDARQVLTAYTEPDGAMRWSQALPYPVTSLDVAETAGVLLLPVALRSVEIRTNAGDVVWTHYSTRTVALDARTGRQLWQAGGDVVTVTRDTALLVEHDVGGLGARRLWLVRIRDGGTVWSRGTGGAYSWAPAGADPARPSRLATVTPAGDLAVYRFADGAEVARARVPWQVGTLSDGTYSELYGTGEALYVFTNGRSTSSVTAYRTDTLTALWRVEGSAAGGPAACGAVVCLPDRSGFAGYDWATGTPRWRISGHEYAEPAVGDLLLTDGGRTQGHVVLDGRTGRVVADLESGGAVWDRRAGTIVGLTPTRSSAHRTSVSWIEPRTARTFLLGTVDRIVDSHICQLRGDRLACATSEGMLAVTDLR
jgi:outer membrane protein assembly factor BamB